MIVGRAGRFLVPLMLLALLVVVLLVLAGCELPIAPEAGRNN
jgi:hypothetical protein